MTDRIADPWGPRTPYGPHDVVWPARVDTFLAPGLTEADVEEWVPSASVLHSNGDAMEIAVAGGRIVGVRGRAADRVNRGRLDPKDLYGWQANHSPDRLRRPHFQGRPLGPPSRHDRRRLGRTRRQGLHGRIHPLVVDRLH